MHREALWQHSSNSNIKIVHNSIEYFSWNLSDLFSDDVLFCLWIVFINSVFQVPPQKIARRVEILGIGWPGNRIGLTQNESVSWDVMPEVLKLSVQEMRWSLISRTEHLSTSRKISHGTLILRQTDNPWSSYSQDLNLPDYFLRGYLKETEFVKTIQRVERTSSEEKSNGFHKKCSIELWTILMFELLLCCHTAAQCMERTCY